MLKWLDYESKYGFGYKLSNDSFVVHFLDRTRLVLDKDLHHVTAYRKSIIPSKIGLGLEDTMCFTISKVPTHPEDLMK